MTKLFTELIPADLFMPQNWSLFVPISFEKTLSNSAMDSGKKQNKAICIRRLEGFAGALANGKIGEK